MQLRTKNLSSRRKKPRTAATSIGRGRRSSLESDLFKLSINDFYTNKLTKINKKHKIKTRYRLKKTLLH